MMLPFAIWFLARIASTGILPGGLMLLMIADPGFWFLVSLAVMKPIFRVRQWQQSGIMAKLLLLGAANFTFYAGIMGRISDSVR